MSLVSFLTCDVAGVARGRSVPVADLDRRLESGLGWVPANQSLTPFGHIVEANPFDSFGDLRLIPDAATRATADIGAGIAPFDVVLCDITHTDGSAWECCPRAFLADALAELHELAGVEVMASFEHEFVLHSNEPPPHPFSLIAQRRAEPFGSLLVEALNEAGCEVETFLPEYGPHQFEVPTAPVVGVAAADRSVLVKELVREVAFRVGRSVSFSPKLSADGTGNGAHIHMSLISADGGSALFDPHGPARLSTLGASFCAGILRHLPALLPLTCGSVISYERLGPHHWSSAGAYLAEGDREAALRLAGTPSTDGSDEAGSFNVEYRPSDATANPYLALGAIVRAGAAGIRDGLAAPTLGPAGAADPLPTSLDDALEAFEADATVREFLSPTFRECFVGVKREEIRFCADRSADETYALYAAAY